MLEIKQDQDSVENQQKVSFLLGSQMWSLLDKEGYHIWEYIM